MDNPDQLSTHHFDDIEQKLDLIRGMIDLKHSRGIILRELNSLLSLLHSKSQPLYTEAIFTEFYPVYLKLLGSFRVFGSPPAYSRSVLRNAKKLYSLPSGAFKDPELAAEIKRISAELKRLKQILSGEPVATKRTDENPLFPVIESGEATTGMTYLDSLDVKVNPASGQTVFIVHPTYKEEETILLDQVKDSFNAALTLLPKSKKKIPTVFEVQVFFNSRLGIYSGNSFGVLLTILIYFELCKILEPNHIHRTSPRLAFTGAVDTSGKIAPVGKRNIKRKLRSVFFSDVKNFIIARDDEPAARTALSRLHEKWPDRALEITAVNNVTDILNRRDIILISKRPIKERVKASARKHKYTSLVLIPVLVLLGFLYAREFDTNPVSFELDGTQLKILNKYGVVLWGNTVHPNVHRWLTEIELATRIKIIDRDSDGENEILGSSELVSAGDGKFATELLCLNGKKESIWRFSLDDTVSSPKEGNIPPEYYPKIVDTISLQGKMRLLIWANNGPTYPTQLFYLDPITGGKASDALWNGGHINQVGFADIDGDGEKEIVLCTIDNGLGVQRILAVEKKFSESMIETRENYMLIGKPVAKLLLNILLPATDYVRQYTDMKVDYFPNRKVSPDENGKLSFFARYAYGNSAGMYTLVLDTKTHEVDYFISGGYRNIRDSLVNAGKLPLPYTDTKEYTDNLKNQVRYKLDGKWVTYAEYKKSRGKD